MDNSMAKRVNQLDALLIDDDCIHSLSSQLFKAFSCFEGKWRDVGDEVYVMVKYMYFINTYGGPDNYITPGNKLQNIIYVDGNNKIRKALSGKQKLLYALLDIFLPYVWKKLKDRSVQSGWRSKQALHYRILIKLIDITDNCIKTIDFLNFILFLTTSEYRTPIERYLRIKLVEDKANLIRSLDFTFVNRVIIWDAVGKVFMYFLPFINIGKIKDFFQSSIKLTGYMTIDETDVTNMCAICKTTHIIMPHTSKSCKHVYCYYCAESLLEEFDKFNCPNCETEVTEVVSNIS